MNPTPHRAPILWIEGAGFCVIILFAWLAEALRVPQVVFDDPGSLNWTRPLIKTAVVCGVWACVHFATRRLLNRVLYLERFLLLCGWCRKIGHNGEWKTTEQYFDTVFSTPTSHGVCPACSQRVVQALDENPRPRPMPAAKSIPRFSTDLPHPN